MTAVGAVTRKVLQRFRVARIMTIAELTILLNCSVRTARRRLKSWGAMSSYNGNGRFYTVPQVARFDENGLWRCRGVYFSRHGNLTETVVALVDSSQAGLTASELSEVLGVNAHSFVSRFAAHPQVTRKRIEGRYVYFASDPDLRQRQRDTRQQLGLAHRPALPSDAEAVLIFAEMIRHPKLQPEQVSSRLRAGGTEVDPLRIRRLLQHHGLTKKGAPDSTSFSP